MQFQKVYSYLRYALIILLIYLLKWEKNIYFFNSFSFFFNFHISQFFFKVFIFFIFFLPFLLILHFEFFWILRTSLFWVKNTTLRGYYVHTCYPSQAKIQEVIFLSSVKKDIYFKLYQVGVLLFYQNLMLIGSFIFLSRVLLKIVFIKNLFSEQ